MYRASDIIDLPIISLRTGKRICTAKSLIIDTTANTIFALLCKERIVKRCIEILPYKSVIRLDYNGVVIYDSSVFKRISNNSLCADKLNYENLIGKFILNKEGELLGTMTDIYFNIFTGKIQSYEISEGYLDDFLNGRKVVSCIDNDSMLGEQLSITSNFRELRYKY